VHDTALEQVAAIDAPVHVSSQATAVIPLRAIPSDTQHSWVLVQVAVPQAVAVMSGSARCAGPPPSSGPVVGVPLAPGAPPVPGVPLELDVPLAPVDEVLPPAVAVDPLEPDDTMTGPPLSLSSSPALDPFTLAACPPQAAADRKMNVDNRSFCMDHPANEVLCMVRAKYVLTAPDLQTSSTLGPWMPGSRRNLSADTEARDVPIRRPTMCRDEARDRCAAPF